MLQLQGAARGPLVDEDPRFGYAGAEHLLKPSIGVGNRAERPDAHAELLPPRGTEGFHLAAGHPRRLPGRHVAPREGAGGAPGGANIAFTVGADCTETVFTWDSTTKVLTVGGGTPAPQPDFVTIPGSLQSELGCSGDWQPDCAATHLTYDATDGVWQESFDVPVGSYEYKAAINNSWDENYGLNAARNGSNIPLHLGSAKAVKFYYDHKTHWATDDAAPLRTSRPSARLMPLIRVCAVNSTNSAPCNSPAGRSRRPYFSLASTAMERPSGV